MRFHRLFRLLWRRLAAAALMLSLSGALVVDSPAAANASQFPPVGSSVCIETTATGFLCGTVSATDVTVMFPEGEVHNLFLIDICIYPGRHGAPVWQGSDQVGTVYGSTDSCGIAAEPLNPSY